MHSKKSSKKSPSQGSDKEGSEGKEANNEKKLFPIVGIGASAGGLEAFIELLKHLPTDTGMAFVLIQHMSPNQESLLSEILSKSTEMPVSEVHSGIKVAPNHVYVIPPNVSMAITNGVLNLTPRDRGGGQFMSVDTFLLSLAQEQGNKAIAVILSGGDGDGSRGLEAVKAAGGVTFAQSGDTAKVNSMPNTAVATGLVDFVLPPRKIAEKIAEISRHPYITDVAMTKSATSKDEFDRSEALRTIFTLLWTATGVDFTNYKQTTLKRRIQRRMVLHKFEKLTDYASYLHNNPTEVMALYEDSLIHVTSFFRDSESFTALKSKVFPVIVLDKSSNSPIRIWVAGCSTGEEAYSITICLLEFLAEHLSHIPIQVYATDISERAIAQARTGFYTASEVANVDPERLHRFFVEVEGGYQISKPVRETCVFARQNLISDPPFSRMDLITCRNVLIYLGSELQKKLLPMFHYGLKPKGFLMLGTSETVGDCADLFSIVDKKNKLYAKKLVTTELNIDFSRSRYPAPIINPQAQTKEGTLNDQEISLQADQIVLNQYAPVGIVIDTDLEILRFRGQTSAYLEPAPGRASFNLLKMAKVGLRNELRILIQQAKQQNLPIKREGVKLIEGNCIRTFNIHVTPFSTSNIPGNYFLILFEDFPTPVTPVLSATQDNSNVTNEGDNHETARLQEELNTTKEHLQAIISEQQATNQDLRSANEEILSSNEELQSMNEELETAKEEIQATNEELNTINDELQRRNLESTQITNDLQNLLGSINIPILMVGSDLRIRRFTPAVEGIFNLISTDVGRSLSDITHKLNVPDLEQQILEVIRTLNLKVQEIQDQTGHWYDLRIRPYRTIDNKIDGAVVVLVDINELKRSAEELTEARNYAEMIVETVREPLLVLNLDLRVVTANHSFYEMFHVLPTQTEQHLLFDLGNGQWNIPELRILLEDILSGNDQFENFEVEHDFQQIGRKSMLLNARKMPPIGDTQMILLAMEDITEQKQLEAQHNQLLIEAQSARTEAEFANRAKDEFLSTVSHELRNPLNAMIGWAQLLRWKNFDQAKTEQALEIIERSAKSQNKIIEDILDISRITTGKFRLNAYHIELVPVIESAIDIVRLAANAKNIQLECRLSALNERVLGDPDRLQQVIWNLLSNAIKFTPAGGKITISLDYIDTIAQIEITDTGQGIKADFLPYVFERFRQADGSYTRLNTGLGLGLAIVRHLVELHGGTVHAHSLGEQQGATFTVRLPVQTELEKSSLISPPSLPDFAAQPKEPLGNIPSLAGVRVLFVDDEPDMLKLFTTMLESYGIEVTTSASASEALSILTANPNKYDVLISDIGMPEVDGYELIRQVRALSPEDGGNIRAAALTAYIREQDSQMAIAAGFQIHIPKPVELDQLLRVIANLAGR
ncbi:PAS domain-containing protein [Aetokthonos hydrillicola Thurmond2011]|jgi:two-component system CheB/CheR fusion protein|uniref:Circadian input-output histidine kinase CikA n=1 Tax=Aetokthonos hydrillicola Thurmond2011 TaxID=2712845 RepID=A0AAP5IBE1_9CYAN|nr:chemotaxis protein CheB [Aetokthonos hydrillicola]MBO3461472.1 response regulator [Aetokthonos hydrillicola CCALA 1050]MBW4584889.1 PAS domain-containing protein [Aetokthonos hydrillicola CCALA 1050]MDR9898079.1 PAS domain-containing protein [Aetokthonos hydrillicola Thurmond2011]